MRSHLWPEKQNRVSPVYCPLNVIARWMYKNFMYMRITFTESLEPNQREALASFTRASTFHGFAWFSSATKRCLSSGRILTWVVHSRCIGSLMRETDARREHLFTWSRSRQLYNRGFISPLPSSFCIFLILNLFVTVSRLGVGEEIGTKSLNCCGMRINASKCWTNLACACEECVNRTQSETSGSFLNYYRLEFCSSFPLNEVLDNEFLRNRTYCQKQSKTLQEADNRAYDSYRSFEGILARIDCGENWKAYTYSTTSTCFDCLVSNFTPFRSYFFLMKGTNVKWLHCCLFCMVRPMFPRDKLLLNLARTISKPQKVGFHFVAIKPVLWK